MTEAEEYVKKYWPDAQCHYVNLYWPGQGSRKKHIVVRSSYWSGVDGSGDSIEEAWNRAAINVSAMISEQRIRMTNSTGQSN